MTGKESTRLLLELEGKVRYIVQAGDRHADLEITMVQFAHYLLSYYTTKLALRVQKAEEQCRNKSSDT